MKPDGSKVKAITNMPVPESKEDLRRFMGMVTYLGKLLPGLSTITSPLRQLMQNEIHATGTISRQSQLKALNN